uniref:Uncharacterized protein n=1 Tax=Fagus sylvatica TaxID=28930 RepID=A0A2N9I3M4_FAGSY
MKAPVEEPANSRRGCTIRGTGDRGGVALGFVVGGKFFYARDGLLCLLWNLRFVILLSVKTETGGTARIQSGQSRLVNGEKLERWHPAHQFVTLRSRSMGFLGSVPIPFIVPLGTEVGANSPSGRWERTRGGEGACVYTFIFVKEPTSPNKNFRTSTGETHVCFGTHNQFALGQCRSSTFRRSFVLRAPVRRRVTAELLCGTKRGPPSFSVRSIDVLRSEITGELIAPSNAQHCLSRRFFVHSTLLLIPNEPQRNNEGEAIMCVPVCLYPKEFHNVNYSTLFVVQNLIVGERHPYNSSYSQAVAGPSTDGGKNCLVTLHDGPMGSFFHIRLSPYKRLGLDLFAISLSVLIPSRSAESAAHVLCLRWALAGDPGCFPLDDEAYPPSSHWPTLTPVILRSYLVFRVCLDLVPLSRPAPKQCFTPRCPVNCCASTHFGENQLALGSSGISPLTTTHPLILHPLILQHQSARGQSPGLLPLLGSLRFHVLFHSPMGVLFTLPSRYYFTIGHPGVFSLTSTPLLRLAARRLYCSPTTPFSRFRLLPFRSPLLRESLLLSFPLATKMFQFARLSLACPWIQQQFERLTYSGISGSTLIFNSPKHFVAYYALPRLWVPRIQLQENQERKAPPLSARLFGLKNAGFYGRSATPGCRRRPWGDLVVPTGWRRWGRPMDFPSFCRISLKGLKGDSASSCSQGPT